ncbi:putative mitochondrial carrier protein [Ascodesmis nigricans]|uniref:Putative mitochondrial carrier protein n=1 Tax=Ascodesmis nigricans TaxID=341454 RepID=A0A4S2MRI8_9PEZI|nr:putative mitochondrial carrier protein [Ascodesmis nigricans]
MSDPPTSIPTPVGSSSSPPSPSRDNRNAQTNALQGTTAAGARALGTQVISFYFRAPIKAFFRMRVDYMQVARALHPTAHATERFTVAQLLRRSTFGLLAYSVKTHGWGFIPRQVLPPMMANASVGAVLYTTYLQTLGFLHAPSSQHQKRVYPPPGYWSCFGAGFAAGCVQSVVAAPLDALVVRFNVADMLEGERMSIYEWSKVKLKEIGVRGVFSGFSLSCMKESLGYAVFFSTFEYLKSQCYFTFLKYHYRPRSSDPHIHQTITPHYTIEPAFLLLAGITATITQQLVHFPLSKIQDIHFTRLESIDYLGKLEHREKNSFGWKSYRKSYKKTFEQCMQQAKKAGGWGKWLYRGFVWGTVRQVPSTAAGLVVFELVRRRYGLEGEGKKIESFERTILLK